MCNTVRISEDEWIASLSRPEWLNTTSYERGLLVLVTMWLKHVGYRKHSGFGVMSPPPFGFLIVTTTSMTGVKTTATLNLGTGKVYDQVVEDPMFMSETKTRNLACARLAYDFTKYAFITALTPKMFHVFCEYVECDTYNYLRNGDFEDFGSEVAEAWNLLEDIEPSYSTGIHEATTCGYGCIDFNGFWMFSLPDQEPSVPGTVEESKT